MNRVVVTGMGIYSPVGNSLQAVKSALEEGKSGIRFMSEWQDIPGLNSLVAGVVEALPTSEIPRIHRRTMGTVALLGALAARDAVADSALEAQRVASERTGVMFGSTTGSGPVLEQFFRDFFEKGFKEQQGTLFMKVMGHTVAANIASMLDTKGRLLAPSGACASSTQTIGMAYETIREGLQDIVICGGADDLHPITAGVFDIVYAASKNFNTTPHETPRPFDLDRDGIVVSEGGAALVLEEYRHARARGAKIYGEILGYATCRDGQSMTFPSKDGMLRCMKDALKTAKVEPRELDYINAHATGTEIGDAAEAEALRELLGDSVPVSATKGYTGHTLAACGAVETIFCLLMMTHNFLAPTLNLKNIDPACGGLNHLCHKIEANPERVLTSNFAFGGINASLVLGKCYAGIR